MALTFDDGPGPQSLQVADALDRAGVKATFFVTGKQLTASPEVARELVRRGHLLAGHSWDHRYPRSLRGGWTVDFVSDQMTRTAALIKQTTGQEACFYRPPGGFLENVPAAARRNRLAVVMWSIDTLDWKQPEGQNKEATDTIVTRATAAEGQTHPIVLFHDSKASDGRDVSRSRSNTVAAVPRVIDWYRAQGYTFVRMDGRS